ncbi:MAG TPA: single-stranded-DNA-specific exonuclease RecJ [Gammaproteobacteria bacterium]|nr:single-stranded-DNA-specific exonuclease RecJ [Gammaproteobacteria bacterium]
MSHRIVRRPIDPEAARRFPDLHPVLGRIYAARQVATPMELETGLQGLHPPELLGGLPAALDLLGEALREQWNILVIGDFDADGATSTALCMRGLRLLGANHLDYLVPNRFEYGYGLTPEIVAVAAGRKPDLILTVDNGVSSIDGVAAAKALGIRVLVTDHHLPGAQLPAADALVNPNLPGDPFPSKSLAGVGVAFYVLLALRARLREQGWFTRQRLTEPNLAQLLDLVALGTVADVVPLDRNNRILVQQGLARIRAGQCVPGIRALIEVGGRNPARLVAADLGFVVGPRLNAAGRLVDMAHGIECLLTDDPAEALRMARELDDLNRERREIEADMQTQAQTTLERLSLDEDRLPMGLCLYDPDWHQGVIGILASRIKDQVHRPVIVFAAAGEGDIKGSARSVPGVHIRDVLDAVAARHPGMIRKFGGHAMAAGLSLPLKHFRDFQAAFAAETARHLSDDDLHGVLHSDGELGEADLDLELAETLRNAGPWGQGFPEPLFDGRFEVLEQRIVGERHLKLRVRPEEGGKPLEAIAFFQAEHADLGRGERVRLAYRLDVNEFRGVRSTQLRVEFVERARRDDAPG